MDASKILRIKYHYLINSVFTECLQNKIFLDSVMGEKYGGSDVSQTQVHIPAL